MMSGEMTTPEDVVRILQTEVRDGIIGELAAVAVAARAVELSGMFEIDLEECTRQRQGLVTAVGSAERADEEARLELQEAEVTLLRAGRNVEAVSDALQDRRVAWEKRSDAAGNLNTAQNRLATCDRRIRHLTETIALLRAVRPPSATPALDAVATWVRERP